MSDKRYNISYFHGLDSSLTFKKRQVMELYGNVTAPTYDYRNPNVLAGIDRDFKYDENTVLIGSSFGGYLANFFSSKYDIPCLLFNPALAFRSIAGIADSEDDLENDITSLSYIVLGQKDTVCNAELNRAFINRYFKGPTELVIEPHMKHRVPSVIFQKHVDRFFRQLLFTVLSP